MSPAVVTPQYGIPRTGPIGPLNREFRGISYDFEGVPCGYDVGMMSGQG